MKRLLSKTVVVAMAAVFFSAFGAAPAGAVSAGAAVLTGTVTPDPALAAAAEAPGCPAEIQANPGDPTVCSFGVDVEMTGTAAGLVGTAPATCGIEYSSTGQTNIIVGSGTGNLKCNGDIVTGGTISVTCSSPYLQVGPVVVLTGGSCGGHPDATGQLAAACLIQVATTIIAAECAFAIV